MGKKFRASDIDAIEFASKIYSLKMLDHVIREVAKKIKKLGLLVKVDRNCQTLIYYDPDYIVDLYEVVDDVIGGETHDIQFTYPGIDTIKGILWIADKVRGVNVKGGK